jgi:ABC-2 type transport system ATP-binding protein
VLELQNLTKRFGRVTALDGCSFKVERGRVLGFLGRNGAGKTTTMRAIFGLVELDDGRVLWEGKPVQRETRFRFGYMPEERGLYPRMRTADQLQYFAMLRGLSSRGAREQTDFWLQRVQLSDRADDLVETLSHGNQQRVQLAVSLVGYPDLLVLDEPFSGLDPIAADTLTSIIRGEAKRGAAVVFSSHQLDLVGGVCDDIAIVTGGKVVLDGDLEQIRRSAPLRHLSVSLEEGRDGWAEQIAGRIEGISIVRRDGASAEFTVPSDTRPEAIVEVVAEAGRIEAFRLEPPGLEDIFREAAGDAP